jgi:hypothetical protein
MTSRNLTASFIIPTLLLAIVLGCGMGREMCTGETVIEGTTYRGIAENQEQARMNTCSKYCIEGNPEFDTMHKTWMASPRSKAVRDRNDKWAAVASDEGLMKFVESCQQQCLRDVASGTRKITMTCK